MVSEIKNLQPTMVSDITLTWCQTLVLNVNSLRYRFGRTGVETLMAVALALCISQMHGKNLWCQTLH